MERKNRFLEETARTLLQESKLPRSFWAEAVNTGCYVLNRVVIRPILEKTPYELLRNKRPNISYFKVFGSKCFVLKKIDKDGKFDAKSYEAIFLGYSLTSRAYKVFNLKKRIVEESIDVIFHEPNNDLPRDEDDDAGDNEGSNKATAKSAKATATSDIQQADKIMEQAATTSTAQQTDSQQAGTSSQPADNAISVDDTIKQLSKLNLGG